jgi:hypothetical protein
MGTAMVLEAATLSIASNNLEEYLSKCQVTTEIAEKDVTNFKSGGWKEVTGGLASGGMKITFLNDINATKLDSIMWDLMLTKVPQDFIVKADDATTSSSNPAYSGKVLITGWNPVSGAVGDVNQSDYDWPLSGAVSRGTT